ncbi:unnamed protein product [Ixodes hexagonus]
MEVKAATVLFGRSLQKHQLRYTTMLSDGDSRAFSNLQGDEVYGFVPIEKEDCVNHVSKRMGTALRNLVQKQKGEGRPSLGGKGKLTGELITKLTMYYGWALKGHQGDIDGMQNAVLATYHHVTSTNAQPNHPLCPKRQDSWCKQNKAAAEKQPAPKHRNNLPECVARSFASSVHASLGQETAGTVPVREDAELEREPSRCNLVIGVKEQACLLVHC